MFLRTPPLVYNYLKMTLDKVDFILAFAISFSGRITFGEFVRYESQNVFINKQNK